jgi:hypothetical protein
VTSDWLCMWRESAIDPAINTMAASLCADMRFLGLGLGLANCEWEPCLLTGMVHWSVLESLVRGVRFGTLSHNCVGGVGVGGALPSRHGGL